MGEKKEKGSSRIVVMGGSLGAVEALNELVPTLPADFPAPIFLVVHVPSDANSYLPAIVAHTGKLQVHNAEDGEAIRPGRIYVAPPNHHVTLENCALHVRKGPRENRHRPAIDPLFRTAARAYRSAVIAVLLSGTHDDGSFGMAAVRRRGGVGIVQDPSDAQAEEMPRRALEYAGADFVLPASAIGTKLIELVNTRDVAMEKSKDKCEPGSDREVTEHEESFEGGQGHGNPSVFACPECHGVLWEVKDGKLVRYRCRVGHAYTADNLKGELDDSAERALWAALRALEEKAAMSHRVFSAAEGGQSQWIERLKHQAEADSENANVIRKLIFAEEP